MTYSEAIPYMQRAFAMMKKDALMKENEDDYIRTIIAEDVISRAILEEIKKEKPEKDRTTPIDNQRYKSLKEWFANNTAILKEGG